MRILTALQIFFKKYFLFGLLVFLPIYATIRLLYFIIQLFDELLIINKGKFLYFIPEQFHPDLLLGRHIPGLGLVFTVLLILLIGVLTRNFVGKQLIQIGDSLIDRVPLVRSVYKLIKEVVKNLTAGAEGYENFQSVVMIEYPKQGLYTLAFVTNEQAKPISKKMDKTLINLFVPTTPNPTSGVFIMLAKEDTIEVDLDIEQAFKLIVSGGIITPS